MSRRCSPSERIFRCKPHISRIGKSAGATRLRQSASPRKTYIYRRKPSCSSTTILASLLRSQLSCQRSALSQRPIRHRPREHFASIPACVATFGKPFGLALYRSSKSPSVEPNRIVHTFATGPERLGFHPDDTTPIPRPSRYYGRRQHLPITEQLRKETAAFAPPLVPEGTHQQVPPPNKSEIAIAQPKRLRDKAHLKFVASQPCLIC